MVLHRAQDLGQLRRAEFAGSTGPVAVLGEMCFGHALRLSRLVSPRDRPGPRRQGGLDHRLSEMATVTLDLESGSDVGEVAHTWLVGELGEHGGIGEVSPPPFDADHHVGSVMDVEARGATHMPMRPKFPIPIPVRRPMITRSGFG